ncbi:MAG: pentapeptide repeat-containing protein [Alphaproteobacteria bacterium]|nr:pentapeptide repeat-containing protein [Alphaproteobacteria bacterium]
MPERRHSTQETSSPSEAAKEFLRHGKIGDFNKLRQHYQNIDLSGLDATRLHFDTKGRPTEDAPDGIIRANLRNLDLSWVKNIESSYLENADLTGATLRKEQLISLLKAGKIDAFNRYRAQNPHASIDLSGFDARNAPLSCVNFQKIDLREVVNFENMRSWMGAVLVGALLTDTQIKSLLAAGEINLFNLYRSNNPHKEINLTGLDVSGVNLNKADFRNVDLTGILGFEHAKNLSSLKINKQTHMTPEQAHAWQASRQQDAAEPPDVILWPSTAPAQADVRAVEKSPPANTPSENRPGHGLKRYWREKRENASPKKAPPAEWVNTGESAQPPGSYTARISKERGDAPPSTPDASKEAETHQRGERQPHTPSGKFSSPKR